MNASAGCEFAVDIHPADWRFPAGKSWIAGWIRPPAGQRITDVRACIHPRIMLGLCGLPHPGKDEITAGADAAPRSGFSFLLEPQPGATSLRLEARDLTGRWKEFFSTPISTAGEPSIPDARPGLEASLPALIIALFQRHLRAPQRCWSELTDQLMAEFVAEPLNAHPNPPFIGALEEPKELGRFRYGVIPVTGWLAHTQARIIRLTAVIDPLPATALPHGLDRRDVSGTFPVLSGQGNSAFAGEIALPADFSAPVLLKIFADLDNGQRHLAFAQRFTPQFHRGRGEIPPLVTWGTFTEVIWALYGSARRHAVPRRGLIRAARALWSAYQSAPAYRPAPGSRPLNPDIYRPRDEVTVAAVPAVPLNTVIAPADDMYVADTAQYFQIGREALALVQQACALAQCSPVAAILDLPCGHGRVARWLRTAYPAANLIVSDTQEPGVNFCAAQLGATGVTAALDGRHWAALPGPYDIIWCGSLLTHFGLEQWLIHLRRFAERLSPHGVLVFTTHGRLALDKLQTGEKDYGLPQDAVTRLWTSAVVQGFGYVDYPDTPAYGISVSLPPWIGELIARETEVKIMAIYESAWDNHQDVVVCTRRPAQLK